MKSAKNGKEKVVELVADQETRRLADKVLLNRDPEGFVRFGRFMGLRRYGAGRHFVLASQAPGNDGGSQIVIFEEDMKEIHSMVEAILSAQEQEVVAKPESENANLESGK